MKNENPFYFLVMVLFCYNIMDSNRLYYTALCIKILVNKMLSQIIFVVIMEVLIIAFMIYIFKISKKEFELQLILAPIVLIMFSISIFAPWSILFNEIDYSRDYYVIYTNTSATIYGKPVFGNSTKMLLLENLDRINDLSELSFSSNDCSCPTDGSTDLLINGYFYDNTPCNKVFKIENTDYKLCGAYENILILSYPEKYKFEIEVGDEK